MKDFWKTIKLGVYIFALPLVATAAASAHQWMTESSPITIPEAPIVTTVTNGSLVSTVRSHTITLDDEGVVKGRLVSIDESSREAVGLGGLKVYFARNGQIAQEALSESDGSFAVSGLEQGAYSFIAAGESGFAAYGVNVISGDETAPSVMEVAAVSPKFTAVRQILEKRVPAHIADEITALAKSNNEKASPIGVQGSNRVYLEDGQLSGSIVSIWGSSEKIAGTTVHIVKNDEEITSVKVDEKGNFEIPELQPGVYDFVAAGPTGFAAVSFEAVLEETQVDSDVIDTSAEAQDIVDTFVPSSSLNVALTSPQDGMVVGGGVDYAAASNGGFADSYAAPPIEYAGDAVGCGCAAGAACGGCGDFSGYSNCCGGGAGGAVGGGGFGRLATLAALALGIVAVADGGGSTDAPDQSPFQP